MLNDSLRIPAVVYPNDETVQKVAEPDFAEVKVTGNRYTSKDFMQKEWQHVWKKVWMIAGMAHDCEEPGDYFTCDLGKENLVFVKNEQGDIQGFYNVCQHRGAKLVLNDKGQMNQFSCLYHGWIYNTDGQLVDLQDPEDFNCDPKNNVHLRKVKTEVFSGFVWYCLDDESPSLEEFLGPMHEQLMSWQLNDSLRVEHFTVGLPCNWKVIIDNFQEGYHIPTLHPQLLETVDERKEAVQYDMYPGGHSRMILLGCNPSPNYQPSDEVPPSLVSILEKWSMNVDDFHSDLQSIRPALQKQKRKLSQDFKKDFSHLTDSQLTDNYLYDLFPSCALSVYPEGEYVWLLRSRPDPKDPEKCIFDYWTIAKFPKGQNELYWEHMDMTLTRDSEVEHKKFKFGEQSISYGIDQDIGICEYVQQGMNSAGFDSAILCNQERRVHFLHFNIDDYILRGEQ